MAKPQETRPEDCRTSWMCVYERALKIGDPSQAAMAAAELRRLGVFVDMHPMPPQEPATGGQGR